MWIWICRGGRKEAGDARGRAAALVPPAPARWGTKSCSRGFYSRPYRSPRRLPSQSGGAGQSQRQTGLIQASRKKTLQLHRKNIFQPIKSTCQTTISKKKKREEVNLRRGGGKGRRGERLPMDNRARGNDSAALNLPPPPQKNHLPFKKIDDFSQPFSSYPRVTPNKGCFCPACRRGLAPSPPTPAPRNNKKEVPACGWRHRLLRAKARVPTPNPPTNTPHLT